MNAWLLALASAVASPVYVAVLEFQGSAFPTETLKLLSDVARTGVRGALPRDDYLVMTRESMRVILDENGGCTVDDGECEVSTGRSLGAKLIVSGQVSQIGRKYVLILKLHETVRGALLAAEQITGRSEEEVFEGVTEKVKALVLAGIDVNGPAAVVPSKEPAHLAAACERRDAQACRDGANLADDNNDAPAALRMLRLGCDVDNAEGALCCFSLGFHYEAAGDDGRAGPAYARGCRLGYRPACDAFARVNNHDGFMTKP